MINIRISNDTMDLIAQATLPGHAFRQNGTKRPDGRWDVPINEETYQRLLDFQQPGDTFDTVISRMLRGHLGRRPN